MAKWDPLFDLLTAERSNRVEFASARLEQRIGFGLPPSAYDYDWWWANEDAEKTRHMHCRAWRRAGFLAEPDRSLRPLTFRRGIPAREGS